MMLDEKVALAGGFPPKGSVVWARTGDWGHWPAVLLEHTVKDVVDDTCGDVVHNVVRVRYLGRWTANAAAMSDHIFADAATILHFAGNEDKYGIDNPDSREAWDDAMAEARRLMHA